MNADDVRDFNAYLRGCTNAQVQGVYDKECNRGGDGDMYAALAEAEARFRGIELEP